MDAKEDCFLVDVRPTEKNGQEALDLMTAENKKYSAKSDIKTISTAYYQTKNLIEAINGDDENSFVNRWGGEIIYDNYNATINKRIGGDYGVQVLYGKNIVKEGFSETVDMSDVVTRIVPKAYNGYMLEGDEPWIDSSLIEKYPTVHYGVMSFEDVKMRTDASEDDEENGVIICDTQEELEKALKKKCEEQFEDDVDKPKITIEADMELLQNTELYDDVMELEKVSLGDTVHCNHSKLGITSDARVIELEWDAAKNKMKSVVLGDFQYNFLSNASSVMNRVEQAIRTDGTLIGQQVMGIINGVKAQLKAQSTVAKKQAVRAVMFEDLDPSSPTFGAMCIGTLGFEIASERTEDGRDWKWSTFGTGRGFFADFIVAGTMLADRILGGTLRVGGIDDKNGIISVTDNKGNKIAEISNEGINNYGIDGWDRRVQIKNGTIMLARNNGDYPVYIDYFGDKGITIRKGGKINDATGGKTLMRIFENEIYFDTENVGPGTPGKTGRAEFSDGTYIDVKKGFVVGGNTKEGAF